VLIDDKWPIARLIPTTNASGVEAQERNAASTLLAVMANVKEFGRVLLKGLGATAGTIRTYTETPFHLGSQKVRPDGLIAVSRGDKTWVALVETKVAGATLSQEQIHNYLDIAREHGYDAVLSISNQYVTSSRDYPIEIDKRRTRKVKLAHLSWMDILTEAVVQKDHRGVSDPDQAYILDELIRYLKDPKSGVVPFDSMGPGWTKVKDGARAQTLRKTDEAVAQVAGKWDDLVRYLCLSLTTELGRDVKPANAKQSMPERFEALKSSLATEGILEAGITVPDAHSIWLKADLRSRQVTVASDIDAPREGRSKGRLGWLVRQLGSAPDDLRIEAKIARSQQSIAETLAAVRENADVLVPDKAKEIKGFQVSLSRPMGLKRDAGKGSFIDGVLDLTEEFYRKVLQGLRPWKPAPPKLKPKSAGPEEGLEEVPAEIAEAVEEAHEEMAERGVPSA
jgi:hypothetical protein